MRKDIDLPWCCGLCDFGNPWISSLNDTDFSNDTDLSAERKMMRKERTQFISYLIRVLVCKVKTVYIIPWTRTKKSKHDKINAIKEWEREKKKPLMECEKWILNEMGKCEMCAQNTKPKTTLNEKSHAKYVKCYLKINHGHST